MSLGIQPSFSCSCSLPVTQTCTHTPAVKWDGAVTMHMSIQTPSVGNPLEGREDPSPRTLARQSCPHLTLIRPLSHSLDYTATGALIILISLFVGEGVQLHLIKSSISNSLQQREHDQLVLSWIVRVEAGSGLYCSSDGWCQCLFCL